MRVLSSVVLVALSAAAPCHAYFSKLFTNCRLNNASFNRCGAGGAVRCCPLQRIPVNSLLIAGCIMRVLTAVALMALSAAAPCNAYYLGKWNMTAVTSYLPHFNLTSLFGGGGSLFGASSGPKRAEDRKDSVSLGSIWANNIGVCIKNCTIVHSVHPGGGGIKNTQFIHN